MAAFNFPNSPSTNDIHNENGVSWKWNGSVWKKIGDVATTFAQLNVTGISTFAGITTVTAAGALFTKQLNVVGVTTFTGVVNVGNGDLKLGDANSIVWGEGGDALAYHTGSAFTWQNNVGDATFSNSAASQNIIFKTRPSSGGAVERVRIDSGGRIKTNGETGNNVNTGGIHLKTVNAGGNATALILENHGTTTNTAVDLKFVPSDASPDDRWNAIRVLDIDGNNKFDTTFWTCPGGTPTEKFRITYEGKVGVNVTDPLSEFHVKVNGSHNGTFRLGGSTAPLGLLFEYDQASNTVSKITANPTYTNSSALLKICVDGDANADQLVLNGGGKIGINIADNTNATLQVRDGSSGAGSIRVGGSNSNGIGMDITYSNASTTSTIFKQNYRATNAGALMKFDSGYFTFHTGTAGAETLRIDSSGKLGLGQPTPASRLHISEAGSNTIQMQFTNATTGHSGGTDGMTFGYSTSSSNGFINVCESAAFIIKTGGTASGNTRFQIASDGDQTYTSTTGNATFTFKKGDSPSGQETVYARFDRNGTVIGGVGGAAMLSGGESGNNMMLANVNNGHVVFGTGTGGAASPRMRIRNDGHVIIDTPNNGYSGLKIYDDTSGDYNIRYIAGRNQSATAHIFMDGGRNQNATPWVDATPNEAVRLTRGKGISFQGSTQSWLGNGGTTNRLKIQTEDKDVAYFTESQVLSVAKIEHKVVQYSAVTSQHWNASSFQRFAMNFYTGNSSATYHVCRMISQTDWGFDNIEFKVAKYQYSYASNDLFSRRFRTYYGGHYNELINYNQQGSGSGTGSMSCLDWRQDFGPGGSHTIHQAANGGYYRDCYGSDVYISLGVYEGFRLEVTVWANTGLYDTGTHANAQAFYPAAFQGQASQSDANSWGGPRGVWFNTTANGTGTGSSPGIMNFSTGNNYGQSST